MMMVMMIVMMVMMMPVHCSAVVVAPRCTGAEQETCPLSDEQWHGVENRIDRDGPQLFNSLSL